MRIANNIYFNRIQQRSVSKNSSTESFPYKSDLEIKILSFGSTVATTNPYLPSNRSNKANFAGYGKIRRKEPDEISKKYGLFYFSRKINSISFGMNSADAKKISQTIAKSLYKYRKLIDIASCKENPCPKCCDVLESRIMPVVQRDETMPISIICFPFKAPSRLKTLGPHPDKAEEISLHHLGSMIEEVESIYRPNGKHGAKLTIYSDNLVFSRAELNPSDDEARTYINELNSLVKKLGYGDSISIKTMDDVEFFDREGLAQDIETRRQFLVDRYGKNFTEEKIREKMEQSIHYRDFVCGLKRFNEEKMKGMFATFGNEFLQSKFTGRLHMRIDENNYVCFIDSSNNEAIPMTDSKVSEAVDLINKVGQEYLAGKLGKSNNPYVRITESNGKLRLVSTNTGRKRIDKMIYEVLHLDQSWVTFINENTKEGLRISMHNQPCGSFKLGIDMAPNQSWIAPWQGCAVKLDNNRFALTKSNTAINCGCELVHDPESGQPYYYILPSNHPDKEAAIEMLTTKK